MQLIEVVGSVNVDLVSTAPRIPNAGETLRASSFSVGFGGKGANQAVACARMLPPQTSSPQVRLVGAVGQDQFGRDSLQQLHQEAVGTRNMKSIEGEKTGTTVIIVEEGSGENRILFTPGANFAMTVDCVVLDETIKGNVVLFQLELPFDVVMQGIKTAKAMGKVTVLNPAPASPLSDDCYAALDHLIVNESEASILSGVEENLVTKTLDDVADRFLKLGVRCVVITLGSSGVFWKLAAELGQKGNCLEACNVKAVDTTAAGDTFVGAYAAFLAEHDISVNDGHNIRSAIQIANRAASLSVQKPGAQTSIPSRKEVEAI